MGSWLGIFKATTLVDCDIHQNSTWLHFLDQRVGYKLWSLGSWNQDGANN
jgi:hypothetical protein